ncbi:MAG: hypothetical protein M1828_003071 [Chrysothrix sp. TS-e1954]|nr:MAG: hypothetical protein M1828_003071 [Chrysothrix sp. TS-e1954]
MPYYLLHGFRWPRPLIRIHIILQNLEDAAAEWLIAPDTTRSLLENLHDSFPDLMKSLPHLRFIEQYDPSDLTNKSQPYAYVADTVEEIKLGVDIDDVRGQGTPPEQWSAMLNLRDKLCEGQKVGWFAVVCGDEERLVSPPITPKQPPSPMHQSPMHQSNGSIGSRTFSLRPSTASASTRNTTSSTNNVYSDTSPMGNGFAKRRASRSAPPRQSHESSRQMQERGSSISRGLKKVFSTKSLKKATSMKNLKQSGGMKSSNSVFTSSPTPDVPLPPPPLPGTAR